MITINICKRCGCSFEAESVRKKYCDECKIITQREYHTKYNKTYNATRRFDETVKKREYKRTTLKKKASKDQINSYLEYCKNNYDKVEGCLNCICSECIQSANDDYLIWEKDEGFYEENYRKM